MKRIPACWNYLKLRAGARKSRIICGRPMVEIRSGAGELVAWRCSYCHHVASVESMQAHEEADMRKRAIWANG